jgi:cytochrome c biogenesis protein CcdA/thiol-disulfide isomerase/thioredoxin
MLLLLISFVAGVLTILAPCVLPVLPIIIGGSIGGHGRERARPYIIGASLAGSIIFFTLLLKVSTILVSVPPDVLNYVSGGLLIALGLAAALPAVWEKLVIYLNFQAASQRLLGKSERNRSKYLGPILTGVALGPVFASCSPTYAFILASVLPGSFAAGLIYLITYTIGLALALLVISLGGKQILTRYNWAVDTHSIFRRALGVLFIIIGVVILAGFQVRVETWVANHLPFDETRIERILLAKQDRKTIYKKAHSTNPNDGVLNVQPTPAPQFAGLTNWINSKPLTLSQLKGKVVLVDFWTFSCVNCIRTIPFLEKVYQTYADKGFVIVGVNTPEFAFEHNPANVAAAVARDGITYPVALDNNYDTWNAYDNDSWPADYLIDTQGDVRYVSLGEGGYSQTEKAIQALLGLNTQLQSSKLNTTVPVTQNQTPETYFGTNRDSDYVGTPSLSDMTATFHAAATLGKNNWSLNGSWQINPEYITSESDSSTLSFHINAKDVYVVAGTPAGQTSTVAITLPASVTGQYGSDAPNGQALINGSRLYHIVSLSQMGDPTITLQVPKGVSLYTFTFGS